MALLCCTGWVEPGTPFLVVSSFIRNYHLEMSTKMVHFTRPQTLEAWPRFGTLRFGTAF